MKTVAAQISFHMSHKKNDSTVPAWYISVFHAMNCRGKGDCKENLQRDDGVKTTIVETIYDQTNNA